MKKNILIVAPPWLSDVEPLAKALVDNAFQVVRAKTLNETLYRLGNEVFSIIIYVDTGEAELQHKLADVLSSCPYAATTPIVLLGTDRQPRERVLLTSLLDQYFPLTTDPTLIAEFAAETYALRSEKAKRGRVGKVSVPQILNQASRYHLSGAIVVERSEEKCIIYVENGYVVFASSNRDENRFGEFLVQQGIISKDQFLHAARLLEKSDKRFGRILVDEGFLKPQVLKTLIQSQVKHIVYTVFNWRDGEYYLLFDERSGQDEALAHFEMGPLILEGVRFKFDEETLDREFEPFDQKVSLTIPLSECQRRMRLNKNSLDFLRLVGTGRHIQHLLSLNSYSRLEALKFLYSFRVLGFLTLEHGAMLPDLEAPTEEERAKVFDELFDPRKITQPSLLQAPPAAAVPTRSKGWQAYGYMIAGVAGALTFSIVVLIATFIEPRMSKESRSQEQIRARDENTQIVQQLEEAQRRAAASAPEVVEDAPVIAAKEVPHAAPEQVQKPELTTARGIVPPKATNQPPKIAMLPKNVPTANPAKRRLKQESEERTRYQTLMRMADRQKRQGRLLEAMINYQMAQKLQPRDFRATIALADTLFELDRTEKATTMYRRAQALRPRDHRSYLALGTIHLMRGAMKEARNSYWKYLSLVPNTTENRPRIAEVRKILKNLDN